MLMEALARRAVSVAVGVVSCLVLHDGGGVLMPPAQAVGPGYVASRDIVQEAQLKPCAPDRNCVSSNYLEPPNRYVAALQLVKDRETAFATAVKDLSAASDTVSVVEILPKDHYIHLTVPGTTPSSLDDVELLFRNDQAAIVQIRCEARVTLPVPPFCLEKNCINGNMDQRRRLTTIATRVLGLPAVDRERMMAGTKWTPIFFNADRVPDFDDSDY